MKIEDLETIQKITEKLKRLNLNEEGWELKNISFNYYEQGRITIRLENLQKRQDEK